jgi:hypothetical protein
MAKKDEIFQYFRIFSKLEVQKSNIYACLTRLIKLGKKKIISDILWWEV